MTGLIPGFRGEVIRRGDAGFSAARSIWNGQVDRRPEVIAGCRDAADVAAAIRYARGAGLPLSVRGGGHNVAGHALCDAGLVVDLSAMRGVVLDHAAGRVRVQGGARLGDLDAVTVPEGCLVPAGIVTDTGIGGLTLGGGIGWASRRFGLTCDHLTEAELVTADGRILVASEDDTPELLWALRGGGGNFAVVTRFTFRTRRISPSVVAGFVVYPLDREVLAGLAAVAALNDPAITTITFLRLAPPLPWMPAAVVGEPVIMVGVVHTGDNETALRAVDPLRRLGASHVDTIAPAPFLSHQAVLDAANPAGHRYFWSSQYVDTLNADLVELLIDQARSLSAPGSLIALFQLGGAVANPDAASCVPFRSASWLVTYGSHWLEPAEDSLHAAWTRTAVRAAAGFGLDGGYTNFESDHHRTAPFPAPVLQRLAAVKRSFDPENVFCRNLNIPPGQDN
ncbi:FAD-binding oxidoreductase [Actinoplanes subglobosus]|uniref:FAD-binding oxidoreductase n=1 Tax=Actinoplanes subglobosus TaxID=1547892 RepID=A0ABV8J719_9ACTN